MLQHQEAKDKVVVGSPEKGGWNEEQGSIWDVIALMMHKGK